MPRNGSKALSPEARKAKAAEGHAVIARRKARKKKTKAKASQKKSRKKKRRREAVFNVRHTEGRIAYHSLLDGKAKEVAFTPQEQDKLAELVAMLTQKTLLKMYTTWPSRAIAVGVSTRTLFSWRQSKLFKQMLMQTMQAEALVGVAIALPSQIDHAAKPEAKGGNQSFKNIADLAGASQPKNLTLTQNNTLNMTWEQQLANISDGKIVDVEDENE